MRRNILEVRAVACGGKAPLDILQPRAILIYDEPDVRTAGKAGTAEVCQQFARDGLERPPLFGTTLALRVEVDSCAV